MGGESKFQARDELFWPEIDSLLDLSDDGWRERIRGTALKRARVAGLIRNLMVVVGNSGVRRFKTKLDRFLDHPDAVIRSHARWALERLARI